MANEHYKPMPVMTGSEISEFWSHVDKSGLYECWEWTGYRRLKGYGCWYQRTDGKQQLFVSSRIAYYLSTGVDPLKLLVCHHCDNPPCCNPGNLFPGTCQDNLSDMALKGRGLRGLLHPVHTGLQAARKGEMNGSAKISDEQAMEIRRLRAIGMSCPSIAPLFGLSRLTVYRIVSGRLWKHLPLISI